MSEALLASVPALPGSYALRLRLPAAARVAVGRLGVFAFPAGDYLYLGSALGPGGLRARLRHHLRVSASPHWHLDALRPLADPPTGGWYAAGPVAASLRLECAWSQALLGRAGALAPAPGFGAADCRAGCRAHLVFFPAAESPAAGWAAVADCLQDAAGVAVFPFGALPAAPAGSAPQNRVQ